MDVSECKDCKRFVSYEYPDHGDPYVLCYWRTNPKKPWSRNEHSNSSRSGKREARDEQKRAKKMVEKPAWKVALYAAMLVL